MLKNKFTNKWKKISSISVIVVVDGCVEKLQISLSSVVEWVDEIIVLNNADDIDGYEDIAKQYGANYHTNTSLLDFTNKKNYAKGDWILLLNADEQVSFQLKKNILKIIKNKPNNTVYSIRKLNFLCGKQVDVSCMSHRYYNFLYPNTNSPLFTDKKTLLEKDKNKKLSGFLYKHISLNLSDFISRRLDIAMAWAIDKKNKGKKVRFYKIMIKIFFNFIKSYIFKLRFIRGKWGFAYSLLIAQHTFNRYALLYDLNKRYHSYSDDYQTHKITYKNLPDISRHTTKNINSNNKSTLSLVMIVKNEQRHLPACLNSAYRLADEIIILDSGSTDNTKMIAEHYGAKWYKNTDWQGFGKQRQLAQSYAIGDYILVLDADETLDNKLCNVIRKLLENKLDKNTVFSMRRRDFFCGNIICISKFYYDKMIRLYPNHFYTFHNYDVHESVDKKHARVQLLDGYINHFTNDNLFHFLVKNAKYSQIWAEERKEQKKKNIFLISIPIRAIVTFLRIYLVRGALFGGVYGFFFALASVGYNFNKYLILWFFKERSKVDKDNIV